MIDGKEPDNILEEESMDLKIDDRFTERKPPMEIRRN